MTCLVVCRGDGAHVYLGDGRSDGRTGNVGGKRHGWRGAGTVLIPGSSLPEGMQRTAAKEKTKGLRACAWSEPSSAPNPRPAATRNSHSPASRRVPPSAHSRDASVTWPRDLCLLPVGVQTPGALYKPHLASRSPSTSPSSSPPLSSPPSPPHSPLTITNGTSTLTAPGVQRKMTQFHSLARERRTHFNP